MLGEILVCIQGYMDMLGRIGFSWLGLSLMWLEEHFDNHSQDTKEHHHSLLYSHAGMLTVYL